MLPRILSFVTVVSLCLCLIGKPNDCRVKPHTRLLYELGGGTNIFFFSYMRCRVKQEENYTFHRYRFVPRSCIMKTEESYTFLETKWFI